ncbi:MAG: helix-turn-helix domain-containing protein [Clostridia bacterium]|nr:helix-turn-helix domain-containing protein [Clostridia bacterium]
MAVDERANSIDAGTVPLWHKSTLTIAETVIYSGIGRGTLYKMTDREDCPFVLWIGNKRRIKRRAFDEYIDKAFSV